MFVVDTNVLIYATNRKSPFHPVCHGLMEKWRNQSESWYLTGGICYEYLRVVTHPRVLENPWTLKQGWSFLEALLESPGLGLLVETDRHWKVAAQVVEEFPHSSGNLLHDLHTAVLMREHGIQRIYSRDTDFHRFPFIEPVDPITTATSPGLDL